MKGKINIFFNCARQMTELMCFQRFHHLINRGSFTVVTFSTPCLVSQGHQQAWNWHSFCTTITVLHKNIKSCIVKIQHIWSMETQEVNHETHGHTNIKHTKKIHDPYISIFVWESPYRLWSWPAYGRSAEREGPYVEINLPVSPWMHTKVHVGQPQMLLGGGNTHP